MAKDLKHLEIRRHRLRRIRATQNLSGRSPGPIHWPTAPLDTNNTSEYQTSIAMEPGARCSIDASSSGSVARFINHSCMPNAQLRDLRCGMDRRLIAVLAPRTIEVGVELTINYGDEWFNVGSKCLCGTAKCKSRATASAKKALSAKNMPRDEHNPNATPAEVLSTRAQRNQAAFMRRFSTSPRGTTPSVEDNDRSKMPKTDPGGPLRPVHDAQDIATRDCDRSHRFRRRQLLSGWPSPSDNIVSVPAPRPNLKRARPQSTQPRKNVKKRTPSVLKEIMEGSDDPNIYDAPDSP
jgi:hypothetical protein